MSGSAAKDTAAHAVAIRRWRAFFSLPLSNPSTTPNQSSRFIITPIKQLPSPSEVLRLDGRFSEVQSTRNGHSSWIPIRIKTTPRNQSGLW